MDIFSVLKMIGGLALFLYGMNVMGEGLTKASGGKLERILEKLTSNPVKAVLLGAGVTAVIQSSSATTVMVVGFVNSGIMKLRQAVGIIMGANIGTTATAWILSLTGLEGDNVFVKLLKPSSFSPVMALVGIILIMFMKREKLHDIGKILIGFAILMTGMDSMSAAVKPLADVPEFTNILLMFSNPILGLLAGAVLTAIIQSSSASVGILQALCATGSVGYSTALPIIMGQNIGTCVTAMISSVGASKGAKRAALVHLYFNVVGTMLFMIVFYALNVIVEFSFMGTSANAAGIAVIHTVFNVFATAILLPFGKLLEKLAYVTIPEDAEEKEMLAASDEFALLDDRFLDRTGLAMEHCKTMTNQMADLCKTAIFDTLSLFREYDEKKEKNVKKIEERVDKYEDQLGTYLMKLSSKDLNERDSKVLTLLLHTIGNYERIADHACDIAAAAKELNEKGMEFSEKAKNELMIYASAIREIIDNTNTAFQEENLIKAVQVEPLEEVIDGINKELKARHVRRLREGKCTIELGFIHSDILANFERVADHCSNIAAGVLEVRNEEMDIHEYLGAMKKAGNAEFGKYFTEYEMKYQLP